MRGAFILNVVVGTSQFSLMVMVMMTAVVSLAPRTVNSCRKRPATNLFVDAAETRRFFVSGKRGPRMCRHVVRRPSRKTAL